MTGVGGEVEATVRADSLRRQAGRLGANEEREPGQEGIGFIDGAAESECAVVRPDREQAVLGVFLAVGALVRGST